MKLSGNIWEHLGVSKALSRELSRGRNCVILPEIIEKLPIKIILADVITRSSFKCQFYEFSWPGWLLLEILLKIYLNLSLFIMFMLFILLVYCLLYFVFRYFVLSHSLGNFQNGNKPPDISILNARKAISLTLTVLHLIIFTFCDKELILALFFVLLLRYWKFIMELWWEVTEKF